MSKKEKMILKKLVQVLRDVFATEIQDLEPCILDEFKIELTEGWRSLAALLTRPP